MDIVEIQILRSHLRLTEALFPESWSLGGAYIHKCLRNTAFESPALSSFCNAFFHGAPHLHTQALNSLPEPVSRTCVGLFSRSIKGQLLEGTVNEAWTLEGVHIHVC